MEGEIGAEWAALRAKIPRSVVCAVQEERALKIYRGSGRSWYMKQKRWRHVYRREGGWQVAVRRKGKLMRRQFGDAQHAGRIAALEHALEWRDALLRRLAPATMIRKRFAPNTTGVIGVQLARDRTRSGRRTLRYRATWYEIDRRLRMLSFSVDKYGEKRAKMLAIKARRKAISRVLRERRRLRGT